MAINVGQPDKAIRIGIGIFILAVGFFTESWLGLIGLIPLITGLVNFCPLYSLFGIKTCKVDLLEKSEEADEKE